MNDDDRRIRELFLGYEELDDATRREADDWLARNGAARAYFEKLRELEARAREPMPEIDVDGEGTASLSIEEAAAESRSRAALRDRLELQPLVARDRPRNGSRARPWMRRAWIPAAAAAVVVFALWMQPDGPRLSDLKVLTIEAATTTRSAQEPGVLRTGDSFALTFRLESAADVLVFHVDPGGRLELVVPGAGGGRAPRFEAGPVRIPAADAPEHWQLDGNPGPEDFIVAIRSATETDPAELNRALRVEIASLEARDRIVERIQAFLGSRMDDVQVVRVQHRR